MDIQALLQRIREGDKFAFRAVVAQYQRPLFGFLGRMGLSQGHAEEIAQETFIRAWKQLASYQPHKAEFSTWLYTIARNLALHELERASYQREQSAGDALPEQACEQLQPPEVLAQQQEKQRLQAALRKLPLADRSALALAYLQELDMTSIARIEGCSLAAVKTRLHRAKEKLRELLENTDG